MGINSVINKAVFEKFQQLHTERLLLRRITVFQYEEYI